MICHESSLAPILLCVSAFPGLSESRSETLGKAFSASKEALHASSPHIFAHLYKGVSTPAAFPFRMSARGSFSRHSGWRERGEDVIFFQNATYGAEARPERRMAAPSPGAAWEGAGIRLRWSAGGKSEIAKPRQARGLAISCCRPLPAGGVWLNPSCVRSLSGCVFWKAPFRWRRQVRPHSRPPFVPTG